MKVNVLIRKKSGKIIATYELPANSDITLEPQVSKGHKVEELEIPEDYASQLDVVYKKKNPKRKNRND